MKNKSKDIKLIIIDFDDTLSLTEEACFYLENSVAVSMGFAPMGREVHKRNWGKPLELAIKERIPGINPEEFMRILEEEMPKHIKKGKLDFISEQNFQILKKIKINGKKLSILTSRSLGEVKHLIDPSHNLSLLVDNFYHKNNSKFLKPDPRVFDEILNHFNVQPSEAVYVGDTLGDAVCSKKAGLYFIAVLENGLNTKKDFSSVKVDHFALKFTDILDFVN